MSKITRALSWFRDVSVLAEDEQRRSRHPEIDVEHLFSALVSIGGPVTTALAGRGVTLPLARQACEQVHADRLAALGLLLPDVGKWERSFPAEKLLTQSLRIGVTPHVAGSELSLSLIEFDQPAERTARSGRLTRPLAVRLQPLVRRACLRGKADDISRALRR